VTELVDKRRFLSNYVFLSLDNSLLSIQESRASWTLLLSLTPMVHTMFYVSLNSALLFSTMYVITLFLTCKPRGKMKII